MSVDLLRRAASLMRERAKARATFEEVSLLANWDQVPPFPMEPSPASMHHNAWTPAVALAVADILTLAADHVEGRGSACPSCIKYAEKAARLYLQEATDV